MSEEQQANLSPQVEGTGASTQEPQAESFWKGDPTKLPAELQQIYKSMQADYTRKSQQLAQERKKWESQLREMSETLRYYQSLLPYMSGQQQEIQQGAQGTTAVSWDPLDESTVRNYITRHIEDYARQYGAYVQNMLAWQWYVTTEAMKLSRLYPEFDLREVLQYAPQYNWNLETTARALYESRKKYQAAEEAEELRRRVKELEEQLQNAKKQSAFVANGGSSRAYRPTFDPKKVKSYDDIAASIPVESILARE